MVRERVLIAEVESPEAIVDAARCARGLGFAQMEAYTPFPIPELDDALGIRRTRLPWFVLLGALLGGSGALFVQWWTNAFDYPINVGGRPAFSLVADVPIVFETTVLAASFVAFGGVLLGARLPRLYDPLFDLPGFERTRIDRFWLVVRGVDVRGEPMEGPPEASEIDDAPRDVAGLVVALGRLGAVVTNDMLGGA